MESFKLVIDGIDLTKEDRRRIERGIERAMVEALAGKTKGMVFRPVTYPDGAAKGRKSDGAAEGVESEAFRPITEFLPNGGILIEELMAQEQAEQIVKTLYPGSRLGKAQSPSQVLRSPAAVNRAQPR